ncbi:MAG: hypothetical protein IKR28_08070 [Selenomonadaceae bacterium]|nr:hypothetical protein [Selenomonadaceae bacterium]
MASAAKYIIRTTDSVVSSQYVLVLLDKKKRRNIQKRQVAAGIKSRII